MCPVVLTDRCQHLIFYARDQEGKTGNKTDFSNTGLEVEQALPMAIARLRRGIASGGVGSGAGQRAGKL